jgi:hypothetical protein
MTNFLHRRGSETLSAIPLAALLACGGVAPTSAPAAVDPQLAVAANPYSVLSAQLSFNAPKDGCARVVSTSADDLTQDSPCTPVTKGPSTLAVLGLKANTRYSHQVLFNDGSSERALGTVEAATGALPDAVAAATLTPVKGAAPGGYLLLTVHSAGKRTAVAFDGAGTPRWYRTLADVSALGAQTRQQENGNFTSFLGATSGSDGGEDHGQWLEYKPSGEPVASYAAPVGMYTDNHELRLVYDGVGRKQALFFGYIISDIGYTAPSASTPMPLALHSVLRTTAGAADFSWSPISVRSLADFEGAPFVGRANDFDHPNSLDVTSDGAYLVSLRSLSELDLVDATTGSVRWTFGGRNSDFSITGDALGGFAGQHHAQVLSNGHVLLYDNGWNHTPQESRAVEYALDPATHTAALVWEFRHPSAPFTPYMGSAQRLRSGNTLVGFSMAGIVSEVTPTGEVVWEAGYAVDGHPAAFYRATRIGSLYGWQEP